MTKKVINSILNFFFPQKCIGCGEENSPPTGALCRQCLGKIGFPSLIKNKNIFSASDYNDGVAKKAIWMLKYRGIKQLAEPLAELLNTRCSTKITGRDWLVIPIPISKKRLKKRGFNQAELIAKEFTKKTQTYCLIDVLYKTRETPAQVSVKNRKERLGNLKGAFAVKNAHLIKDKNIILIDDVSTTGATIREARKVLRESGAKRVIAMVIAN